MGYRVGNQCFSTLPEAEAHYFGSVVPVIKPDNTLLFPVFDGQNWALDGQVIHGSFASCDPLQNFQAGASLGWMIAGVFVAVFTINIIRGLIK